MLVGICYGVVTCRKGDTSCGFFSTLLIYMVAYRATVGFVLWCFYFCSIFL